MIQTISCQPLTSEILLNLVPVHVDKLPPEQEFSPSTLVVSCHQYTTPIHLSRAAICSIVQWQRHIHVICTISNKNMKKVKVNLSPYLTLYNSMKACRQWKQCAFHYCSIITLSVIENLGVCTCSSHSVRGKKESFVSHDCVMTKSC
jgi:hypothetical protein